MPITLRVPANKAEALGPGAQQVTCVFRWLRAGSHCRGAQESDEGGPGRYLGFRLSRATLMDGFVLPSCLSRYCPQTRTSSPSLGTEAQPEGGSGTPSCSGVHSPERKEPPPGTGHTIRRSPVTWLTNRERSLSSEPGAKWASSPLILITLWIKCCDPPFTDKAPGAQRGKAIIF